jgi:hypothetical protein
MQNTYKIKRYLTIISENGPNNPKKTIPQTSKHLIKFRK